MKQLVSVTVLVTRCRWLHIEYLCIFLWNHGTSSLPYRFKRISSCAFSGLENSLVSWVPEVKSALISNNQGEVPLHRQSRATSHMFLTHRLALHHVLIIATTRDITLERQLAAVLRAEAKTAKLCIRTFLFKRLGVSKTCWKVADRKSEWMYRWLVTKPFRDFLCSYICSFN